MPLLDSVGQTQRMSRNILTKALLGESTLSHSISFVDCTKTLINGRLLPLNRLIGTYREFTVDTSNSFLALPQLYFVRIAPLLGVLEVCGQSRLIHLSQHPLIHQFVSS